MAGVVFDHTALTALGRGVRLVSSFVDAAHRTAGQYVYVPALCLAAAAGERPPAVVRSIMTASAALL